VADRSSGSGFVSDLPVARLLIRFGEQVEVICLADAEAQGSGSSGNLFGFSFARGVEVD
jgi:hypothetical protein